MPYEMPVNMLILLRHADTTLTCPCSGGTREGRAPTTHNQWRGRAACARCRGAGWDAREEGVPAGLGVGECSRALRPGFVEKEAVSRSVGRACLMLGPQRTVAINAVI